MIRINLTDQAAYFRLRKEFLKRIAKYVDFDQADICLDSSQRTGKTEKAAENLKENFPALYHFLFDESGNLREEKLTLLLAGPDLPPQSFGGGRLAKSSMREYLEEIIDSCGCVCTDEAAKNCCKEIFHYEKFVRDKEDASYVIEVIEDAKNYCKDPLVLIEQKLDFSRFVPEGFGTGDCLIVADKILYIIDFKYGAV